MVVNVYSELYEATLLWVLFFLLVEILCGCQQMENIENWSEGLISDQRAKKRASSV